MSESGSIIYLDGVTVSFDGFKALQDVDFYVDHGELRALIGPNGAGKTTLFALMSGFLAPDSGRIFFAGADITGHAPHLNARAGLARTFQIVQPFAAQTVRENIAVGAQLHEGSRAAALHAAHEVAHRVGLGSQLDKPAGELTVASRKRLELARALATRPRLLLLDEVLAGLNPQEIGEMLPVVRSLVWPREGRTGEAATGITVLMIEHDMDAVFQLADRITVLVYGRAIATGTPDEIRANDEVRRAYLGDEAA